MMPTADGLIFHSFARLGTVLIGTLAIRQGVGFDFVGQWFRVRGGT